jgi:hypothetical protein
MTNGRDLSECLLEAHRGNGTLFVHQWSTSTGWFVSKPIPPVSSFFKVAHGKVSVCTATRRPHFTETPAGRIVDGRVQLENP